MRHEGFLKQLSVALFGAVFFISILLSTGFAVAKGTPDGFADLAEKLMPAVVNVSISSTMKKPPPQMQGKPFEGPFQDFFEDFLNRQNRRGGQNRDQNRDQNKNGEKNLKRDESPKRKIASLGSGFVIDPSGIIVTNNHVIEDADEITVTFPNGDKFPATLIGRDKKIDLAVLQIKADKPLPFVTFGDNKQSRVGDWVIAIGNPFGLGGSLSAGVISAINRDIQSGPYDSFIQTDAAINRGNSGGPLFNMDGQVIGVNTAIISPTGGSVGIGFSIPADLAVNVIDQLREFGETRRGWLGVRIQTVTDELAEGLNMDKPSGALISEIFPDGPAAVGGIKQGDVILSFNKKPVREMRDLPRIVAETEIGDKVAVDVWRRGKKIRKSVIVGRLEEAEAKQAGKNSEKKPSVKPTDGSVEILGMTLRLLDDKTKLENGLESDDGGVIISHIKRESPAALAGLRPRSIITEVDQQSIRQPEDVTRLISRAREAGKKSVLVLLRSQAGLRFIALRIIEDEPPSDSGQ